MSQQPPLNNNLEDDGLLANAEAKIESPIIDVDSNAIHEIDSESLQVIAESGKQIGDSIAQLDATVSTLLESSNSFTTNQIVFAIFVAVVGALSAAFFNYFHWIVVSRRERISRIGGTLSRIIGELESIAVDYWVVDYEEVNRPKIRASEVHMKAKAKLIARYVDLYVAGPHAMKLQQNVNKLSVFKYQIFDLVTGDNFESRQRKASRAKAQQIADICSDMKASILSMGSCD